jgi:AcrR family transcriptional regulator
MVTRRRRGQQLEDAILEAAWEIFSDEGYAEVTMKGVAERAGTGKPVLYRRWKDSDALLADAIAAQVERRMPDPPDTGDLREDLLVLLADIDGVLAEFSGSMLTHLAQSFQPARRPVRTRTTRPH